MIIREARRAFKSNPIAYRAWISCRRGLQRTRHRLPGKKDPLYLDGYPRSGNTYFTSAIRSIAPDIRFANHLHVIAPIKIALRFGVPTFILMRAPSASIASHIHHMKSPASNSAHSNKNFGRLVQETTESWLDYYCFVHSNLEQINILESQEGFDRPDQAIARIFELSGIEINGLEAKCQAFHKKFVTVDSTKPQGSTSFPSKQREIEKIHIAQKLKKCALLQHCDTLFNELKRHSILAP